MKIAIATERKPKIDAVQAAIVKFPYFADVTIEYITQQTPSGVADTPLSLEETIQGAQQRVATLQTLCAADWYIGVEGGATRVGEKAYLTGVTYVENAAGEGHIGVSSFLEIPQYIADEVYKNKKDLGPLMEEVSQVTDVRSKNGTYGVLTNDIITRMDQLTLATVTAFAPFFNQLYTQN